jgi:hypothetical protein
MTFRYLFLSFCSIILTLIAYLITPVLALFLDAEGNLRFGRSIFQPPDNPAIGDASWKDEHPYDTDYKLAVSYLWRNPAQGFQLGFAGADLWVLNELAMVKVEGDITITGGINDGVDYLLGKTGWFQVSIGEYWHWRNIKHWGFGIYTSSEFGWRLQGIAEGRPQDICRQLVFTPIRLIRYEEK